MLRRGGIHRASGAACGSDEWEWALATGRGQVYSWTITHRPLDPGFADEVPYAVLVVEMEEGPRLVGNLRGLAASGRSSFEPVADVALTQFRPCLVDSLRPTEGVARSLTSFHRVSFDGDGTLGAQRAGGDPRDARALPPLRRLRPFTEMAALFAVDGVLEVQGERAVDGRDAIIDYLTGVNRDVVALSDVPMLRHYATNVTITVVSEHEATAASAFFVVAETGPRPLGSLPRPPRSCRRRLAFRAPVVRTDGYAPDGWAITPGRLAGTTNVLSSRTGRRRSGGHEHITLRSP